MLQIEADKFCFTDLSDIQNEVNRQPGTYTNKYIRATMEDIIIIYVFKANLQIYTSITKSCL